LHTDWTPPTEREQVLKLIASIITTEPLLIAHILQVNTDPGGLGANFEANATHLIFADPIETKELSRGTSRAASISSTLAGRGDDTGVDLRWYSPAEFKKFTQEEKIELARWKRSDAGKAVIAGSLKKFKRDKQASKKRKSSEISGVGTPRGKGKTGGDSGGGGGGGDDKVSGKAEQKKYQATVAKAVKKMCAASISAEKAEVAAADEALEAAIKRRNGTVISATNVVSPIPVDEDENAGQQHAQKQTTLKLSSVKTNTIFL